VLGTMRFLYGWSLKPMIYLSLIPGAILTAYCAMDNNLAAIVGLAWDCGAVTTGPVTVPLVLALGIGVANSGGKGDSALSGFGIVTLASIFPVIAVLGLGVYLNATVSFDEIKAANAALSATMSNVGGTPVPIFDQILMGPIKEGVQAIVPLVIFLMVVLFGILRSKLGAFPPWPTSTKTIPNSKPATSSPRSRGGSKLSAKPTPMPRPESSAAGSEM
jgi:hypothetical protein